MENIFLRDAFPILGGSLNRIRDPKTAGAAATLSVRSNSGPDHLFTKQTLDHP